MTEIHFSDRLKVGEIRKTADGYLTAKARAARTGIQDYLGTEVGRADMDVVRVYRPEDEVFNVKSMGTFKGKPVTMGHPGERVTADNHSKLAKGHIATVARDGEAVAVDLAITDAATVKAVEDGVARELSAGYVANLEFSPGVTDAGEVYDAIQRNIFVDHVAIVPAGRAGPDFRIGDGAPTWGASPVNRAQLEDTMPDALRTITVDGLSVQTTDAGAQAITKLQDELSKQKTTYDAAIAAKDTEIEGLKEQVATKDGEITALTKKVEDSKITPQMLNDMGKKRAKVMKVGKAKGMSEEDMEEMDDAAIMRAVVADEVGADEAKEMDDSAIKGAFSIVSAGIKDSDTTVTDHTALRSGIRGGSNNGTGFSDAVLQRAGYAQKQ